MSSKKIDENPEFDFSKAKPAKEVMPKIMAKGRGPEKSPKKIQRTIRFSAEVIEYFEKMGPGYQVRIDEALKEWIQQHR